MSQRSFLITLLVTLCTGAIFATWPQIDLAVSGFFYDQGFILGQNSLARLARRILFYLPSAVLASMAIAWVARRLDLRGKAFRWLATHAPSGRGLVFAALAMALGPGLLVNIGLKDHWGRPRPVHVQEFGGPSAFRPWWRTDGSCLKNCSFVSGEVAGAFWLAAPASLAPPPARSAAMLAALAIGAITAAGRVAFGGHFLSDAIFAALFTLLICQLLYLMLMRKPPD
ncbi:MAG: phosphatase PAP2 family protein [Hyphomicrobiales bacterium]|nr:phosphatase PAP2 family protein [Hyphomicrobiales bacterium]